jgi:integrase
MPRIKLTEKIIPTLRGRPPGSKSQEPVLYFDQLLPGFCVSVSTKTGLKTYQVQRDVNGKPVRRTIGRVGTEIKTLAKAREKAGEIIQGLRHGIDPRTTAKGELTLAQAADAYMAARPNMAERSKLDYARVFDSYLADWRDMKLSAITREMVERRHLELGEQRGKATANGVMRTLRAIFNWAIDRYPGIGANPVRLSRQWFKVHRRESLVSADELPRFYKAVLALESELARDYVLLLLWTGMRRDEAATLRWQDVDLVARVVRLPATKTKARRKLDLPTSTQVLRLLLARRKLGNTEFVFPSNSRRGCLRDPKKMFKSVAKASGIAICAHDLRRTYAQAAITAGVHTLALKGLLNHGVSDGGDVTLGYINLSTEDLREPAQRIADQIAAWCKIR